jgi:MFS family permease
MPHASRRALLRATPDLRRLLTARLVSEAGTWLAYIALAVDVYARTHSGAWIAVLLLVQEGAMLGVGFGLAPLTDRLSRRGLLVVSDLLSACVFAALPFAGSALSIVALAAVAGAVGALYQPALGAALPNLVGPEDLTTANALTQTVATGGLAVGPLAAGVLIALAGPTGAYTVNAASFLLSALVLTRIPAARLQSERASGQSHGGQLLEGLRLFTRDAALRGLLLSWGLVGVAFAAVNVGEVVLARHVLHAGPAGFGLFASAAGVGLVAGGLLSPRLLERWQPLQVYTAALCVGAAGIAGAAVSPTIAVAALCAVVGGVGNAGMLSARTLVVQRTVDDVLRGRAFSVLIAAGQATTVAGMALAGVALDAVGARAVWGAAALLFLLAAAPVARLAGAPARTAQAV